MCYSLEKNRLFICVYLLHFRFQHIKKLLKIHSLQKKKLTKGVNLNIYPDFFCYFMDCFIYGHINYTEFIRLLYIHTIKYKVLMLEENNVNNKYIIYMKCSLSSFNNKSLKGKYEITIYFYRSK